MTQYTTCTGQSTWSTGSVEGLAGVKVHLGGQVDLLFPWGVQEDVLALSHHGYTKIKYRSGKNGAQVYGGVALSGSRVLYAKQRWAKRAQVKQNAKCDACVVIPHSPAACARAPIFQP